MSSTHHAVAELELDQDRMIVLSLKPRFAEAILAGTKTVELRRTGPRIVVADPGPHLCHIAGASTRRNLHRDGCPVRQAGSSVAGIRLKNRAEPPRVPPVL